MLLKGFHSTAHRTGLSSLLRGFGRSLSPPGLTRESPSASCSFLGAQNVGNGSISTQNTPFPFHPMGLASFVACSFPLGWHPKGHGKTCSGAAPVQPRRMKVLMLIHAGLKIMIKASSACRVKLSTTQRIIGLPGLKTRAGAPIDSRCALLVA